MASPCLAACAGARSGLTGRRKNDEWLRLFDAVIVGCAKVGGMLV